MSTLDAQAVGSEKHDEVVREIASKYRDSGVAQFAINDYRDFLLEELGVKNARAEAYRK